MTESLQQVTLQKKNELQQAASSDSKAKETTPEATGSVVNPISVKASAAELQTSIVAPISQSAKASESPLFATTAQSSDGIELTSSRRSEITLEKYMESKSAAIPKGSTDSIVSKEIGGEITATASEWESASRDLDELENNFEIQTNNKNINFKSTLTDKSLALSNTAGLNDDIHKQENKDVKETEKSDKSQTTNKTRKYRFTPEQRKELIQLRTALRIGKISEDKFLELRNKILSNDLPIAELTEIIRKSPSVSQEEYDEPVKKHAVLRNIAALFGAKALEAETSEKTEERRLKFLEKNEKHEEKAQKEISEKAAEIIPENCDKQVAEKILKAAASYTDFHAEDLKEQVKNSKILSPKSQEKLNKILDNAIKKNHEYQEKFIKRFWETAKGQAIIRHARYVAHEYFVAKKEYEKTQEEVERRTQEADEAREAALKAKEEVQLAKKKAASVLLDVGIKMKDLTNLAYQKTFKKIIKNVSPRAYVDLQFAKAKEKEAYWAEWDANALEEHAKLLSGFAEQKMEYANAKLTALMRNI